MKRCSHGLCNSDSRYSDKPYMIGITFHRFPSFRKNPETLKRWVLACNRLDFDLQNVKKNSYICSKHFVDPGGPSQENPDPVLATEQGSCRSRRKLRPIKLLEHLVQSRNEVTLTNVSVPRTLPGTNGILYTLASTEDTQMPIVPETRPPTTHPMPEGNLCTDKGHLIPTARFNRVDLSLISSGWSPCLTSSTLAFVKILNWNIVITLKVTEGEPPSLNVFGFSLDASHPLATYLAAEKVLCESDLYKLITFIDTWTICNGNKEEIYPSHCNTAKQCIKVWQTSSLHSRKCLLMLRPGTTQNVCKECRNLKRRLAVMARRAERKLKNTTFKSSCNIRYLPLHEVKRRMKLIQKKLKSSTRQISRLKAKRMGFKPEATTSLFEVDSEDSLFEDIPTILSELPEPKTKERCQTLDRSDLAHRIIGNRIKARQVVCEPDFQESRSLSPKQNIPNAISIEFPAVNSERALTSIQEEFSQGIHRDVLAPVALLQEMPNNTTVMQTSVPDQCESEIKDVAVVEITWELDQPSKNSTKESTVDIDSVFPEWSHERALRGLTNEQFARHLLSLLSKSSSET